jgi:branched-chain amino acid transport system ATP-binding protein
VHAIEITSLQIAYGRLTAVHGLDLALSPGEALCIVGPNGAGKSSTLLAIACALRPRRGDIRFFGDSIIRRQPEDICRMGLCMVPEGRGIFPALTVRENLMLGTFNRAERAGIAHDLARTLERFPIIAERMHSPAGKLSGGEQQQLAIARALMCRPRVLLLDEPSLGLAPMMTDRVYDALSGLRAEGLTLLVVEQSLSRALAFGDRVLVMREGAIQAQGSSRHPQDHASLEAAYFGFHEHADTAAKGP